MRRTRHLVLTAACLAATVTLGTPLLAAASPHLLHSHGQGPGHHKPTPSPTPTLTTPPPSPSPTPTPSPTATITPSPSPSPSATTPPPQPGPTPLTRPDHVVIVIEENHSYSEVISAPYISSLAAQSANMTQSFAITHPSEPNYLALWSGSTQGVTDDSCPLNFGSTPSLGGQLVGAGLTTAAYSESLPSAGYTGCTYGAYARKHNPLADFSATANSNDNLPFTSWPSTSYASLPAVSIVVPNLNDDMHDGTVATADTWLKNNISSYATWAQTHNSLLIVTADEDDSTAGNQIPTLISGQHVQTGNYSTQINHYNVLSTIEDTFGLSHLNSAAPITGIWK